MGKILPLHNDEFYKNKAIDLFNKGCLLIKERRFKEIVYFYKEAVRFDEENAEYHYSTGVVLSLIDEFEEAEGFFRRAYELETENMEYLMDYGDLLYELGKYEASIDLFKKVGETQSCFYKAQKRIARSYIDIKQYDEAILLLRKLIHIENDFEVNQELGFVYMMIHKYYLSEKHLKEALKQNNEETLTYDYLHRVYLKLGQHEKAISVLEELKLKHPEDTKLIDQNIEVINLLKDIKKPDPFE